MTQRQTMSVAARRIEQRLKELVTTIQDELPKCSQEETIIFAPTACALMDSLELMEKAGWVRLVDSEEGES